MSCMSIRGRVSIVSIGIEVRVVRIGRAAFLRFFVSVNFPPVSLAINLINPINQSIAIVDPPCVFRSYLVPYRVLVVQ